MNPSAAAFHIPHQSAQFQAGMGLPSSTGSLVAWPEATSMPVSLTPVIPVVQQPVQPTAPNLAPIPANDDGFSSNGAFEVDWDQVERGFSLFPLLADVSPSSESFTLPELSLPPFDDAAPTPFYSEEPPTPFSHHNAMTSGHSTPRGQDTPSQYSLLVPAPVPQVAENVFRCQVCSRQFKTMSGLKQHGRTHSKPEECMHCLQDGREPRRFASKKELQRHIHAKHAEAAEGKSPNRRCPFRLEDGKDCRYFSREDNVTRHSLLKHKHEIMWRAGKAYIRAV